MTYTIPRKSKKPGLLAAKAGEANDIALWSDPIPRKKNKGGATIPAPSASSTSLISSSDGSNSNTSSRESKKRTNAITPSTESKTKRRSKSSPSINVRSQAKHVVNSTEPRDLSHSSNSKRLRDDEKDSTTQTITYKKIKVGRTSGYPIVISQGTSEHDAILLGCNTDDPQEYLTANAHETVKIRWQSAGYNQNVPAVNIRLKQIDGPVPVRKAAAAAMTELLLGMNQGGFGEKNNQPDGEEEDDNAPIMKVVLAKKMEKGVMDKDDDDAEYKDEKDRDEALVCYTKSSSVGYQGNGTGRSMAYHHNDELNGNEQGGHESSGHTGIVESKVQDTNAECVKGGQAFESHCNVVKDVFKSEAATSQCTRNQGDDDEVNTINKVVEPPKLEELNGSEAASSHCIAGNVDLKPEAVTSQGALNQEDLETDDEGHAPTNLNDLTLENHEDSAELKPHVVTSSECVKSEVETDTDDEATLTNAAKKEQPKPDCVSSNGVAFKFEEVDTDDDEGGKNELKPDSVLSNDAASKPEEVDTDDEDRNINLPAITSSEDMLVYEYDTDTEKLKPEVISSSMYSDTVVGEVHSEDPDEAQLYKKKKEVYVAYSDQLKSKGTSIEKEMTTPETTHEKSKSEQQLEEHAVTHNIAKQDQSYIFKKSEWYYRDNTSGAIQGPFSAEQMIGWKAFFPCTTPVKFGKDGNFGPIAEVDFNNPAPHRIDEEVDGRNGYGVDKNVVNERSKLSKPVHEKGKAERTCSCCKELKCVDDFSKSQRSKGELAKCKKCIISPQQGCSKTGSSSMAAPSQSQSSEAVDPKRSKLERTCSICKVSKVLDAFSKNQRSKGNAAKCKECISNKNGEAEARKQALEEKRKAQEARKHALEEQKKAEKAERKLMEDLDERVCAKCNQTKSKDNFNDKERKRGKSLFAVVASLWLLRRKKCD